MKISEVLRKAKRHIGRRQYICHAIEEVSNATNKDKAITIRYIEGLLKGNYAAENWLYCEVGISFGLMTRANMLAYRRRWIDHMINELEKEGK